MSSKVSKVSVIDITPHHGAMTKAGKANFVRFCDGASEFIDNSIQAYLNVGNGEEAAPADPKSQRGSCSVSVRLFMHSKDAKSSQGSSYMVVEDSGSGMDENGLKEFATYSLDKETRKQGNEEFISKFGVGAKQSGFFLGDRIRVITSPAKSSEVFELKLDENVFEDRYKKGEQVFTADVYQRPVGSIDTYAPPDETENKLMMSMIESFEKKNSDHFTVIVIRLRDKIVRDLYSNNRFQEVPYELALIYHYHLHPDNRPDEILNKLPFLKNRIDGASNLYKASNSLQRQRTSASSSSSTSSRAFAMQRSLDLRFSMYEGTAVTTSPKIDLLLDRLRDDDMHEYVKHAKAVFRCNFTFPDPNVAAGKGGLGSGKPASMQCIFFYYPYVGRETRPRPKKRKLRTQQSHLDDLRGQGWTNDNPIELDLEEDVAAKGGSSSSSSSSSGPSSSSSSSSSGGKTGTAADHPMELDDTDDESYVSMDEEEEDLDPDAIDVFWVNRLVPQTTLHNLPFLPKLKGAQQCDNAKISVKWRERIKGFVFLDHSWDNISNNKLKIQVDPDLETYLNDRVPPEDITYQPKSSAEHFKLWLADCHRCLDKECRFHDRMTKEEAFLQQQLGGSFGSSGLFRRLDIGEDHKFSVGDKVKLKIGKNNQLTKSRHIVAEIVAFDADVFGIGGSGRASEIKEHYGRGYIRYLKIPKETFHPSVPAKKLNPDDMRVEDVGRFNSNERCPVAALDPADYRVTDGEVKGLRDGSPVEVQVFLFKKASSDPILLNRDDDDDEEEQEEDGAAPMEMEAGVKYFKFGARILDVKGRYCVLRPGNKKDAYRIRMRLKDEGRNGATHHDYGQCFQYWQYSAATKGDVQLNTPEVLSEKYPNKISDPAYLSYYGPTVKEGDQYLPSLVIKQPGKFVLEVEVIGANGDKMESARTTVPITVVSQPMHDYEIEWLSDTNMVENPLDMDYRIGSPLPAFKVRFMDREGNTVSDHGDHLRLSITSKECTAAQAMENGQEPQENPVYQLVKADNGCFQFFENTFVTIPKDLNNPVLSADRIRSRNVEWSFNLYLQPDGDRLDGRPSRRRQATGSSQEYPMDWDCYTQKLGETKKFSIRYIPTAPKHLKMLPIGSFAQPLEVQNHSTLPPIEMAVLDKFGNRTSPEGSRQKWKVVVGDSEFVEGLSSTDDCEAEVSNDGLVSFKHLRVSYDGNIGPAGEETAVGFFINCSTMKGRPVKEEASQHHPSAPPSADKDEQVGEVLLRVLPKEFPDTIEVLHRGQALPQPLVLPLGSTLDELTFRVLRKDGAPLQEFKESWIEGSKCGIVARGLSDCPWGAQRKGSGAKDMFKGALKFDTSEGTPALPNIRLPDAVDTFDFELVLRLYNDVTIGPYQFEVTTAPGEAVRWHLVTPASLAADGIISRDHKDLTEKVQAVVLVDKDDNIVPWDHAKHPPPHLFARFSLSSGVDADQNEEEEEEEEEEGLQPAKRRVDGAAMAAGGGTAKGASKKRGRSSSVSSARSDSEEAEVMVRVQPAASGSADESIVFELPLEEGKYLPRSRNLVSAGKIGSQVALSLTQLGTQKESKQGGKKQTNAEKQEYATQGVACFVIKPGAETEPCLRLPRRTSPLGGAAEEDGAHRFPSGEKALDLVVESDGSPVPTHPAGGSSSSSSSSTKRKASEPFAALQLERVRTKLTPGMVTSVLVECASLGVPSAVAEASLEVNRFTEADFNVYLVDEDGHVGRLIRGKKFKGRFQMSLESLDDEERIRTAIVKKIPVPPAFTATMSMSDLNAHLESRDYQRSKSRKISPARGNKGKDQPTLSGLSFSLSCDFIAERDGKELEVAPATLTCQLLTLNLVTKLRLQLLDSATGADRSGDGSGSGHELDALLVTPIGGPGGSPGNGNGNGDGDGHAALLRVYCDAPLPRLLLAAVMEGGSVYGGAAESVDLKVEKDGQSNPLLHDLYWDAQPSNGSSGSGSDRGAGVLQWSPRPSVQLSEEHEELGVTVDHVNRCPRDENRPMLSCGHYTITATYTERRPNLLKHELDKVTRSASFEVVPQTCASIHGDPSFFHNAVACNYSDASAKNRQIRDKVFRLSARDAYGNNTTFAVGSRVGCLLARGLDGSAEAAKSLVEDILSGAQPENRATLPALLERGDDGLLWGSISENREKCQFPPLVLEPGVGEGNGPVDLVFFCSHGSALGDDMDVEGEGERHGSRRSSAAAAATAAAASSVVEPWLASFVMETDTARLEQANAITAKLRPLQAEVKEYDQGLTKLEQKSEEVRSELHSLLQHSFRDRPNLQKFCSSESTQPSQTTRVNISRLSDQRNVLQKMLDRLASVQPRPAKKDNTLRQVSPNESVVGHVVDLGFVDTDDDAAILSGMASRQISSLVVRTRADGQKWYAKNVKVWPLDMMTPFLVQGAAAGGSSPGGRGRDRSSSSRSSGGGARGQGPSRPRTKEEMDKGELPLAPLSGVAGHPRYLVNLIQLRSSDEHLRDTVFWNIFRNSLLFEDLDSATKYRQTLAKNCKPPVQVVTKKGDVIATDGMMDPGNRIEAKKLRFMFGEMPAREMEGYIALEEDIRSIDQAMPLVRQLEELSSDIEGHRQMEDEIANKRQEAQQLQKQLPATFTGHSNGGRDGTALQLTQTNNKRSGSSSSNTTGRRAREPEPARPTSTSPSRRATQHQQKRMGLRVCK